MRRPGSDPGFGSLCHVAVEKKSKGDITGKAVNSSISQRQGQGHLGTQVSVDIGYDYSGSILYTHGFFPASSTR